MRVGLGIALLALAGCGAEAPSGNLLLPRDAGSQPPAYDAGPADAGQPDAGQPDAGQPDAGPCAAGTLTWGNEGGFGPYSETSVLDGCGAFTLTRTPAGDPSAGGTCGTALDAASADQITQALAHPDVVAALAAAPVLYGLDKRMADGPLLVIDSDGRRIEVGFDCDGSPGCAETPAGVAALVTALRETTEHVRATEPSCAPLRRGPNSPLGNKPVLG